MLAVESKTEREDRKSGKGLFNGNMAHYELFQIFLSNRKGRVAQHCCLLRGSEFETVARLTHALSSQYKANQQQQNQTTFQRPYTGTGLTCVRKPKDQHSKSGQAENEGHTKESPGGPIGDPGVQTPLGLFSQHAFILS